tara:strand:- start:4090 stop:5184 length:1095 start_codon:yes stop_codon:yes gene_type:complete
MRNICFIISTFKKSGPINIVYSIAKFLEREKFNLYVISLSATNVSDNNMVEDFKSLGATTFELKNGRVGGFVKNKREVKQILIENKIDIVHTHGLRPDGLVHGLRIKSKHISTLHNYPFEDYPMKFGGFKGSLMAAYHFWIIKRMRNCVACSKSLSTKFTDRGLKNVKYIQNGVDLTVFPKELIQHECRESLKLPLDKKIFIFIGSLIPRKSPIETIQKFIQQGTNMDFCLLVLGDGFLRDQCEAIKDENVILMGNVDNVKPYLFASDYFISLSKSEGLPNTVMEAMAAKLPVILSEIPSHREIIDINRQAGILVNDNNFYKKVQELVTSDYKSYSNAAFNIVSSTLNAKVMAENYEKFYLKLT